MKREFSDDDVDEAYSKHRQQLVDDEAEARAMQIALIAAADEGRSAGMHGFGASLNPYQLGDFRNAAWERARMNALCERFNGRTRRTA